MRVRFHHRIDLCTEITRQDNHIFFGLYSGEVYIMPCADVLSAERMLEHIFVQGFVDLSQYPIMDKYWNDL